MERFVKVIYGVNFRKGPGTGFDVIKLLPKGTVVEVLDEGPGTWYKGRLEDGSVGYLSSLPKYTESFIPEWLVKARKLIDFGKQFLDVPYLYGSTRNNTKTFDCSDFVQYVFRHALGIKLDGDSRSQSDDAPEVSLDSLRTGDLVFFQKNGRIYHVAIYVHDDKLLHTYNDTATIYDEDLKPTKANGGNGKGGVTFTKFSGYWKDKAGLCKAIRPIR